MNKEQKEEKLSKAIKGEISFCDFIAEGGENE